MNRRIYSWILCLVVGLLAVPAMAQWPGEGTSDGTWHVSANGGFLTGGTWLKTRVQGEPVKLETDAAWLVGAKAGIEDEYLGVEISLAGAFADADLEVDPAAFIGDADDVSLFLGDVNALWFPFGNNIADGRIRPFVTGGPGILYFDSDFGPADSETALDINAGAGVKLLLGDEGDVEVRLDYRWHYFTVTTSGLEDNLYRQELTAGVGFRF